MQPGTSHSGDASLGRRRLPAPFAVNVQLSTPNLQPPCFDNLPHSSTTSRKPPLCFHIHTNTFFRNPFLLTSIQKDRGCTPATEQTVEPKLEPRQLTPTPSTNHRAFPGRHSLGDDGCLILFPGRRTFRVLLGPYAQQRRPCPERSRRVPPGSAAPRVRAVLVDPELRRAARRKTGSTKC